MRRRRKPVRTRQAGGVLLKAFPCFSRRFKKGGGSNEESLRVSKVLENELALDDLIRRG